MELIFGAAVTLLSLAWIVGWSASAAFAIASITWTEDAVFYKLFKSTFKIGLVCLIIVVILCKLGGVSI